MKKILFLMLLVFPFIASADEVHDFDMDIYINALEESNAKYEYLMGLPSIQDELKKNFRAVKPVRLEIHNGKEFVVYKCFIGTSKFDKEEMSMILETILKYATELGIPTGAYYD